MKRNSMIGSVFFVLLLIAYPGWGEVYPQGKVTWIVGHPPGGGIDLTARGLAPYLEKYLKALSPKPEKVGVVIKNLPGGAEMRAMNELYRAAPDGYTVASGGDILHTREVMGTLGFPITDITFLARLGSASKVVVTYARSPLRTWGDVVATAKKSPVRIAVTGFGASNHVATILLIATTGLPAKPVIFDGTAGANAALMRGDVLLGLNSKDSLKTLIEAKELRPLLDFSEKTDYPGCATVKDIGYPQLVEPLKSQRYLIGPPRMPNHIKRVIEKALRNAFADKAFNAWVERSGLTFSPVLGRDVESLVQEIQLFYKGKETKLREYLAEK